MPGESYISLAPGWKADGQGAVWRQEILQEAIAFIQARVGEPRPWGAEAGSVGRSGQAGGVEETERDNFLAHILKDRELMV